MSNPSDLKPIVDTLNDTLVERTNEKDYDSMFYFTYCENWSVRWVEFGKHIVIDSENGDLYDDEKEDFIIQDLMKTGDQKVFHQIKDELEIMKKNIDLALKIVKEGINK